MRLRPIQIMLALICLAIAVFLSGCGAPPANQNAANSQSNAGNRSNANVAANSNESMKSLSATCTSADDVQIERQIRILIEEDAVLRPFRKYINVDSKSCIVKLQGYVDHWDKFKLLYDKVYNADGVKKIDVTGFNIRAISLTAEVCSDPFKQCGEICIPKNDDCTIPVETKADNSNTSPSRTP